MVRLFRRCFHLNFRAWVVIGVGALVAFGCGSDPDTRTVDFSVTMPSAQPGSGPADKNVLRVAVGAMISPKETFVSYRDLLEHIGNKLEMNVQLIQRKTYREINEGLGKGEIDLAFICSGPYATGKDVYGFELVAAPEVHGSHFYHSYLIVHEASGYSSLDNLRGKIFAFTDPDSNTGRLVPTFWLGEIHERPETFFEKTIFTYSHDNSILAVARGLVDGAAVDGLIWEYYHQRHPDLTSKTRVIRKSEPYGIPPLVASAALPQDVRERVQKILFSLREDPASGRILDRLMIDRFVEPRDEWYESIRQMMKRAILPQGAPHDSAKPQG